MPHAAKEHGVEVVQVGVELAFAFGRGGIEQHQQRHGKGSDKGEPEALGHEEHHNEHHRRDDVGGGSGVAVAAQGDVEVVLQPVAEGDMPAFPEPGGVGGLVGRVEVERQVEAHEHGYADGNVGIAGEVGIDLQGVEQQGGEVFERGIQQGVLKHTVDKRDGQPVAEDKLFAEAVENPEDGDAELASAEEEGFVELGNELVGTDNGSGNKLGEEGGVETEVEDIVGMAHFAFVYIDNIADVLEGEEADADRQDDGVGYGVVGGGDGVEDVGEEVGVFEIAQHAQVDHHARNHQGTAALGGTGAACDFAVGQVGKAHAEEIAHDGCKDEQTDIEAGGLVVEEEAHQEEIAVAPEPTAFAHVEAFAPQRDDEAEEGVDDEEEGPEMELGEEQRMLRVEGEEVGEVCEEVVHG